MSGTDDRPRQPWYRKTYSVAEVLAEFSDKGSYRQARKLVVDAAYNSDARFYLEAFRCSPTFGLDVERYLRLAADCPNYDASMEGDFLVEAVWAQVQRPSWQVAGDEAGIIEMINDLRMRYIHGEQDLLAKLDIVEGVVRQLVGNYHGALFQLMLAEHTPLSPYWEGTRRFYQMVATAGDGGSAKEVRLLARMAAEHTKRAPRWRKRVILAFMISPKWGLSLNRRMQAVVNAR